MGVKYLLNTALLASLSCLSTPAPAFAIAPVAPLAGPEDLATRDELAPLLRAMETTVKAGDTEAYMALVDRSDACFAKEQSNWFKDLKKQPARVFELSLGDKPIEMKDGAAIAELNFKWSTPANGEAEDKTPKTRELTVVSRFTKPTGQTAWRYAGEEWNRIEGDGVRVLYLEGLDEVAKDIADVFPDVRTKVEEGFGLKVPRVQEIKIYKSMKHLQESIFLSYVDGLAGWNEPGEAIKMLSSGKAGRGGSKNVLAHEFGHVCTFELGPKASDMPWWALEGVAELSTESVGAKAENNDRQVRRLSKSGKLAAWKDLTTFGDVTQENYGKVYTEGHHMLGYISERFGREKRVEWLRLMANGASLDDATKQALGVTFASLDDDWRASVAPKPGEDEPAREDKKPEEKKPQDATPASPDKK